MGPGYGYFPNASKTTLVVKPEYIEEATEMFEGSGIKITAGGQKILGAALGTTTFVKEYVAKKVDTWVEEIFALAKIAEMHPHVAYAAFSHVIMGKWQYIMRTIEDVGGLLHPIEEAIYEERTILSLPTRYVGLNIINPVVAANRFNLMRLRRLLNL